MADRIEYQKKLNELQKYVPFLENTISKLMREPGKPRQQQISKLQSLLEILTDTSRKLKLDALGRCEEVILKLQAQVEKKSTVQSMHKFMCRTPPESDRFFEGDDNIDNYRLADARNRLKQIELVTPASPSPPLDVPRMVPKPVVIPTEKVITVVESRRFDSGVNKFRNANQSFALDQWHQNLTDAQMNPLINTQPVIQAPRSNLVPIPKWQKKMQWVDEPPKTFKPPLYQRRSDLCLSQNDSNRPNTIWMRGAMDEMPYKPVAPRDVITYEDFPRVPSPATSIYEPKPRHIPIVESNRLDLSKTKSPIRTTTLTKPPLSESDLQALLSSAENSSSNSPNINEDMDIDKLEKLRETLQKEIGGLPSENNKESKAIPILHKTTTPIPSSAYAAKPKNTRIVEKVIKEPANIFGNLLSSIDGKIMQKQKKDPGKTEVKKKELIKISFNNKGEDSKTTSKEDSKKSSTKHKEDKQNDKSKVHSNKHKHKERKNSESSDAGKKEEKVLHKIEAKSKTKLDESTLKDDSKSKVPIDSKLKISDTKSQVKTSETKSNHESKVKIGETKSKDESKVKTSETKSKNDSKVKIGETKVKTVEIKTKHESNVTPFESKSKVSDDSKVKTNETKTKVEQKSSAKLDDSKTKVKIDYSKVQKSEKKSQDDKQASDKKTEDTKSAVKIEQKNVESKSIEKVKHNNKTKHKATELKSKDQIKSKGNNKEQRKEVIETSKDVSQLIKDLSDIFDKESNIKIKNKSETEKPVETITKDKHKLTSKLKVDNEDSCSTTYSTKSDSSLDESQKYKRRSEIKYANTGRLSDKYPHKRKISTDSAKSSDSITPNALPCPLNQAPNATDPRLRHHFQKQIPTLDNSIEPFAPTRNNLPFQKQTAHLEGHFDYRGHRNDPRTAIDPFLNSPPMDHNYRSNESVHNTQNRNMRNEDQNFQNNQFRPPNQYNADPRKGVKTDAWFRGHEEPIKVDNYNRGYENHNRSFDNQNVHQYDLTKIGPIDYFETYKPNDLTNKIPLLETPMSERKPIPFVLDNSRASNFGNRGNQGGMWNRGISRGRGHPRGAYDNISKGVEHFSPTSPEEFQPYPRGNVTHSRGSDNHSRGTEHKRGTEHYSRGTEHKRGTENYFRGTEHKRGTDHYSRGQEHKRGTDHYSRGTKHKRGIEHYSRGTDHSRGSFNFHNRGSFNRGASNNRRRNSYEKFELNSYDESEISQRNVRKNNLEENIDKTIQNKCSGSNNLKTETESDLVKEADDSATYMESNSNVEMKMENKGSIQNFKIPKIKRPTIEEKLEPEENEISEKLDESIPKNEKTDVSNEPNTSKTEDLEIPKPEENKTDIVNEFIQKLLQQGGDTSVFLNILEKLSESIPKLKYKRIRKIIDSDSEDDSTHSSVKEEVLTVEEQEKVETPPEEPETKSDDQIKQPENIVESVGERIKSRRRLPPTKTDDTETKKPIKIRKKRSSLEMLQDDIREMFICQGVLTASERQRMCRIIREQEQAFQKFGDAPKKNEEASEEKDITPVKKSRAKPKKKEEIPKQPIVMHSSPRVVLEKTDMSKYNLKSSEDPIETSEDEEVNQRPRRSTRKPNLSEADIDSDKVSESSSSLEKSSPEIKTARRTRSSNKIVKETEINSDSDNASVVSTSFSEKNDSPPRIKRKTLRKRPQKVEEEVQNYSDDDYETLVSVSEKSDSPIKAKTKVARKKTQKVEEENYSDNESLVSLTTSEKSKTKTKIVKKKPRKVDEEAQNHSDDANESTASLVVSEKNEIPIKTYKPKAIKKKALQVSENESDAESGSVASSAVSEKVEAPIKIIKGKIGKKKKKRNWALGVIKNLPRKKMIKLKSKTEIALEEIIDTPQNIPESETNDMKITIKPDINYYLDGKKTERQCKICPFKGRYIVHHYKNQHVNSENLISRLSPKMAQAAKNESQKLNYDGVEPFDEQYKFKKDRVSFTCRFCSVTFKNERACSFYDHVSIHTGEYRYACELCPFKSGQRKILNTHCSTTHHNIKRNIMSKPLLENPPDFRIVFGYICDLCNFTQLQKDNVEKHLKESHSEDENGIILKISMSSKSIPLPGEEIKEIIEIKEVEAPKVPDLNVFMTSDSFEDEEKQIEEERLKKMQEVCEKLKKSKRSGLLFINKLHDKLNTVCDNELHTETDLDDKEICKKQIEIINEMQRNRNIDYTHKNTNIVAIINENTLENEKNISAPPTNTASELDSRNTTNDTFTNFSNLLSTDLKRKPVTSTIQRLTAKLQNPLEFPKIPELPSSEETFPLIINIGLMKVTIYNKNYKKFNCLVENCPNKNTWTSESEFKNHCITTHSTSHNKCTICGGLPLDLIGHYYHLKEVHCPDHIIEQFEEARKKMLYENEESNISNDTVVTTTNDSKPMLKIRKLPGDLLSASIPEKIEIPPENKMSNEKCEVNDLDFNIQILDVKTVTLEEHLTCDYKSEEPVTNSEINIVPSTSISTENEKTLKAIPPFNLKALYKCPRDCNFASNNRSGFNEHMRTIHPKLRLNYVKCTYCEDMVIGKEYATHVDLKHGHCSFLCVYCNYRACTKSYVEVHQQKLHFLKEIIIIRLENIQTLNKLTNSVSVGQLVLPYICRQGTCTEDFLLAEDFKNHLLMMKHRVLICHLCTPSKKFQNIGGLVKHYLAHSIGKQQCKYCLYACTYPEEMFLHYSKSHQTQFPIAILRSIPKVSIIPSEITVNCLELVDLDWIYKDSIHQPITFNDYIKQKGLENTPDTEVDTDIDVDVDVENDIADDVEEVNIQNEIETINLIYDDAIESEKQLESQNEPLITVKHRTKELESEIVNAIDPLNIDPLENIDLNQSEMESVSEVTAESVSNNPDFELFRCGTTDCNFVTDTAQKFKAHLSSCDVSKEEGYFKCIHCTKKFKYSTTLTEHIQIHGTLRYICSICDHRAPFEYLIHKHMKIKHKIHTCKLVPNNDLFIAVPNYKSAPKNQAKTAFESTEEKFSYEPEELEKLPRMAIYSQDRKCARCGYSSKVRTNLFRHLQAHLNDAPVPESAPVNPVPCLEKNEKMFDKMLNLANSSFPGGRMGGKNEKSSVNDSTVPSFVPVSKRFVCGAEGCNYLTHDDSMLKYHFNALHSDDTTYKCPHCRLELSNEMGEVNIDHVVFHLRMHDLHLYKCLLCEYIHYQKHKVEKHITDKHPNKMPYIHVIRELDNSANVEGDQRNTEITITETHKETKEEKFWKCGFCRYRSLSENDIKVHVAQSHGIESQYKCSLCSFQCDTPTDFPLHATTHPNLDGLLLSIYYQCENTAEKSTVTHSEVDSFDTTPLWRRGTAKVKNIRGILIEETRSPKKTPKSQEKTAKINLKCYETISKNLFGEDDLDEPDSKQAMDLIKSFGDFGGPVDNKFSCPFCKEYQTLFKRKFVSHIFKELNYNRYKCESCNFKAHDYNTASEHFIETHSKDLKPNIKPLTPDHAIEQWVDKVLQFQEKEIQKNKEIIHEKISDLDTMEEKLKIESKENNLDVIPHEDLLVASSSTAIKILSPIKVHKCDECNFEGRTLKLLKIHKQQHNKPFHCKLCSYTGKLIKSLKLHFKNRHPNEALSYTKEILKRKRSMDSEENLSPNKKLIIDFDQSNMNVKTNIPEDNIRYSCLHCIKKFEDLNILKLHHVHEHWTLKIKSFCKYKIMDITTPVVTSKYLYKCKHCDYIGTSLQMVDHHQENHPDSKFASDSVCDYTCRFCGYTNKNLATFRKHLRSHNQGQIAYDISHAVSEGEAVKENIYVILDENIISQSIPTFYKCEYCTVNAYSSEELLKKHHYTFHSHLELNLNASTLHKYKCPSETCTFSTNVLNDMKLHVREHTKTYKCVYCPAEFLNQTLLQEHHTRMHKTEPFNFTLEENPLKLNKDLKDSLLILGYDGLYTKITEYIRRVKRHAPEDLEHPDTKIQVIENSEAIPIPVRKVINVAKKSTATPPKRLAVARKSTTPVKKPKNEGYSFYGTKPVDFNEYKNLTTEANIQGNMVRVSVIGLQYILKLFPKVLLQDMYKQP